MNRLISLRVLSFTILSLILNESRAATQILLPSDGKTGDYFGYSVAIDGKTLLVGSHKADVNGVVDAGAAYIFELGNSGWSQKAKLVANPLHKDDTLGGSVALKKDVAMVGVMRRDDKGKDSGAVVYYKRHSGGWSQNEIITATDGMPGDSFGQSLALTEDYLVIGAPRSDALGKDSGAAYIYKREGSRWSYQKKITAKDGKTGDLFGISVAIHDRTILVGADLHDEEVENSGAAYVFTLNKNEWKQEAKLVALDPGKTDIFGVRVAILNNTALISARRDDVDGIGIDAGSVYMFTRNGTNWKQKAKFTSPDGIAFGQFGRGVSLARGIAAITALNKDKSGHENGALYLYKTEKKDWHFLSKVEAHAGGLGNKFGWNISISNEHAAIATPEHNANGNESGAVYVHRLTH